MCRFLLGPRLSLVDKGDHLDPGTCELPSLCPLSCLASSRLKEQPWQVQEGSWWTTPSRTSQPSRRQGHSSRAQKQMVGGTVDQHKEWPQTCRWEETAGEEARVGTQGLSPPVGHKYFILKLSVGSMFRRV